MLEFTAALALFLLSHSIPARPTMRASLVRRLSERAYLLLYSLLSLALLAWLISSAARAPVIPLWQTQIWHYHVALALMLPVCLLLAGGLTAANPLSVTFMRSGYDPARPGIVGVARHPVLWGFALWALVHLLANGALVPVIMFGGFALFALAGMAMLDRRRRRELGSEWPRLAAGTSVAPFGSLLSERRALRWRRADLVRTLVGGLLLYAGLLWLHPRLFGPDPAALLP